MRSRPSLLDRLRTLVIGADYSPHDKAIFHRLSLIAFFAWVGLGADGLSSSCYGPPEAFLALGGRIHLAIFVALGSAVTVFIISAGYSQIIELFPTGGGGYLVASKLLSPTLGMISGCALLVDYVLTITLSIASGADAIFSFLPPHWHRYRLGFAAAGLVLLILLNLRGVKESVMPLVPIFLLFIATHVFAILYALAAHLFELPATAARTAADVRGAVGELGLAGTLLLLVRSYSMGAGTFTGIEAVSNGLPILREPKVETGKHTMRYMAVSLAFMVTGLMVAYILYGVRPEGDKTLNAILFERMTQGWGGFGWCFVLTTLISEAAILFVAAQTGFLDGPRVLSNMALDRWVPTRFALLSDRFVTQNGILLMGGAGLVLMLLARGSVRFLIVLYSINVFITFSLSQLGMVRHWWNEPREAPRRGFGLLVNGVGLVLCLGILVSVVLVKFNEGGWVTILVTGSLVAAVTMIKRRYAYASRLGRSLDHLVAASESSPAAPGSGPVPPPPGGGTLDPLARTAVVMVKKYDGIGLHTLLSIFRMFGDSFHNFVFVEVGLLDAGSFKGTAEVERLQTVVRADLDRYVAFVQRHGYHAEGIAHIDHDVVHGMANLAPVILERFPQAIFFSGRLVFPKDTALTRWLHNYVVFAMQKLFTRQGIPFFIVPIRM